MLTVASLLWDANDASLPFSRCYDESWVLKLHDGFARNLTVPFRFVLFTDRDRNLPSYIQQERIRTATLDYGACVEPFRYGVPMLLCGLDTIVTGDVDHLARYCFDAKKLGLPRDPYAPHQACNGVVLVPAGFQCVYRNWHGENDMETVRRYPHAFLDDEFPGHVVSYKGHVRDKGVGDARMVYFHGEEKPHQIAAKTPWVREHWR